MKKILLALSALLFVSCLFPTELDKQEFEWVSLFPYYLRVPEGDRFVLVTTLWDIDGKAVPINGRVIRYRSSPEGILLLIPSPDGGQVVVLAPTFSDDYPFNFAAAFVIVEVEGKSDSSVISIYRE